MTTTNFIPGTRITSTWLNSVDALRYGTDSVLIGSGDLVAPSAADTSTGQLWDIRAGTAAAPQNAYSTSPLVRIHRTIEAPAGVFGVAAGNSGYTNCAGLRVVTKSTTAGLGQPVGIVGEAMHSGVDAAAPAYSGQVDALGITGLGYITGSGTGIGIGGYFEGSTASSAGLAIGAEVRARNNRGSADTVTTISASYTRGLWVTPGGANGASSLCGVGVAFGYSDLATGDVQWDVGIGFAAWSGTSSVKTTSILDETDSVNSIVIKGTHSGGAIKLTGTPGGTTGYRGIFINETIGSSVTSFYTAYDAASPTVAAAFTLSNYTGFSVTGPTIGAGSAVTTAIGFAVQAGLTTATNNYGFYGNIAAGANRYNLYMGGTAQNYLAGITGIGIAASSTTALAVASGTTGVSSVRIPHGVAPTSPVDGDIWTTTAGLFVRVNGVTVGPLT